MGEFAAAASRLAGLTVIDTAPLDGAPESQIIGAAADRVVLVVELGITRITDLRLAQELLTEVHAEVAGVVIDRSTLDYDEPTIRPAAPVDVEKTVAVPAVPMNGRPAVGNPRGAGAANGIPHPRAKSPVAGSEVVRRAGG